tara:strand:+ start:272 stop:676 length:405 start_codon:yes stop_codon:yes gene_type:complete
MKNVTISTKQVRQILAGSQRLNEMKREIDAIIKTAIGMLTGTELSRFSYDDVVCRFDTPGLKWEITRDDDLTVCAYDVNFRDSLIYTAVLGADQFRMRHVQLVHQALPKILTNLIRVFPSLADRFIPLLEAAPK